MKKLLFALGFLLISSTISSCFKTSYDMPPNTSQLDPNLPVNLTIAQLNSIAFSMNSGQYRTLGDSTISGVVTADDRSGNFYKQIIIQDSTGAILVSLAQYNLYNDYPVGRKVYVKLKGLTIMNYKSLPEIGLSAGVTGGTVSLTGIPSALVPNYVIKASFPNTVTPKKARITDLFGNPQKFANMLVQIDSMEFDTLSANLPYAGTVASGASGSSRTVHDCPYTGNMIMYNSAYATFQPALTPPGKGSLIGIFSMYNTPQFLIRDTSDVKFTNPRGNCP